MKKLSKETKSRISKMAAMGIHIGVIEWDPVIKVRVEQKDLINGYILNQSQLVSRAADVLDELTGNKIHWIPLTFQPDLNSVTPSWIEQQMQRHAVKRKDLLKHLGIDKSTLSLLLSGERSLTRIHRAAFFYYFLVFEINELFRS